MAKYIGNYRYKLANKLSRPSRQIFFLLSCYLLRNISSTILYNAAKIKTSTVRDAE